MAYFDGIEYETLPRSLQGIVTGVAGLIIRV